MHLVVDVFSDVLSQKQSACKHYTKLCTLSWPHSHANYPKKDGMLPQHPPSATCHVVARAVLQRKTHVLEK